DGQPEVFDGAHYRDELLQVHGLADVAVGVEVVAGQDVLVGRGGGQDHHRDALQGRIRLDLRQHLAAVFFGQVEVEQDQVGDRGLGVAAQPPQVVQGRDAVRDHVEVV